MGSQSSEESDYEAAPDQPEETLCNREGAGMATYSIESIVTHAELADPSRPDSPFVQWCEIKLLIPKEFDWDKGSAKLLKQLQFAVGLIGRGDA